VALDRTLEILGEATMRRIISAFVLAVLFAGCASDGKFHKSDITTGPCAPAVGYTYTGIAYGDSKLVVIPLSTIKANTEWRFYLLPIDSLGGKTVYGDSTVTIDGKLVGLESLDNSGALTPYVLPTPPPLNDDWLAASGTYNTAFVDRNKRYLVACVPADVQIDQEWRYLVEIDNVGEVDPRGHVN
jgi:hypothetical protein